MTGGNAFAVATCAFLALWVVACSGGDSTSTGSPTPTGGNPSTTETARASFTGSGRAVVQVDLSSVASPQDTIEKLEQVIQDRLGDAGVRSNISQTSDAELTIDFTGARSSDLVKQVIEAQSLGGRDLPVPVRVISIAPDSPAP